MIIFSGGHSVDDFLSESIYCLCNCLIKCLRTERNAAVPRLKKWLIDLLLQCCDTRFTDDVAAFTHREAE